MGDGKWTYFILLVFICQETNSQWYPHQPPFGSYNPREPASPYNFNYPRNREWRTWRKSNDILVVIGVVIENGNQPAYLNYSNIDTVELLNPTISMFTVLMQSQITKVRRLELKNGKVPTIYVAPHFKELSIHECFTSSVVIDSNITYETENLTVAHNELQQLPANLNYLNKLKELHLHNNQLEIVDMADLNGLNNLQTINLAHNKIFVLSAHHVVIPNLKTFDVQDNRVTSLNFEYWNTTSLQKIYLGRNQLSIVLEFPSAFRRLKDTSLNKNPLNCQWLNATLKELKKRKVTIREENSTNCNKAEEILDELRKNKLQNTFATNKQLENTNTQIEKNVNDLEKVNDSINKLHKANQQLETSIAVLGRSGQNDKMEMVKTNAELKKSDQYLKSEINILKHILNTAIAEIEKLKHKDDDLTEELYLQAVTLEQRFHEKSSESTAELTDKNTGLFEKIGKKISG